jgi:hypothetical protein
MQARNHAGMNIRPAPAAPPAGGSIAWWLVAVVVLGLIVASGIVLTSRR